MIITALSTDWVRGGITQRNDTWRGSLVPRRSLLPVLRQSPGNSGRVSLGDVTAQN